MFRLRTVSVVVGILATLVSLVFVGAGQPERNRPHPVPPSPEVLDRIAVPDSTPFLSPNHPDNPLYGIYRPPRDLTELRSARTGLRGDTPPPNHGGGSHDLFGTDIKKQASPPANIGAYAIQQVSTSITVPDNSTLYLPTLLPSNDARLEVFSAYNKWGSVTREWGIYDHKDNTFLTTHTKIIDGTFINTYTSGGYYSTIVQKYNDGWRVYLWNYNIGNWEHIVTKAGDAGDNRDNGWDVYEEYLGSCGGGLPKIESKSLQVYTSSSWQFVNSTYGLELKSFPHCGAANYSANWTSQFDQWDIDPGF